MFIPHFLKLGQLAQSQKWVIGRPQVHFFPSG